MLIELSKAVAASVLKFKFFQVLYILIPTPSSFFWVKRRTTSVIEMSYPEQLEMTHTDAARELAGDVAQGWAGALA